MFCIRRTTWGSEKASSAYAIKAKRGLRFAKCAVAEAETFESKKSAQGRMRTLKRNDPNSSMSEYHVCEVI